MQIESVYINGFRNLNYFRIDFSEMKTVLIGQNASGKSNFIEAIVLIFKQLDFLDREIKLEHIFDYEIIYICYNNKVKITRTCDENGKFKYKFLKFNGNRDLLGNDIFEEIKKFRDNRDKYLPKYIFAYYSGLGNSNRLEEHFEDHKKSFAQRALKAKENIIPAPPRMLYAELIHSQLSLLSFFIDDNAEARLFLKKHLNIEELQSILLTIKEPYWSDKKKKIEDPKFFGSIGVVRNLLYHLHDNVAFAPFRDRTDSNSGFWQESKAKKVIEVVYLYMNDDDFKKIRKYVNEKNWSSFEFFHVLNTANVSQLLTKEGVKIRVKKQFANKIAFKDLSEGEQQLLTVLGLMRFTKTDEALFLLDEPDTHLNPLWQWKYMDFIDEIVFKNKTDERGIQVIMSSHAPLTIGGLKKEEVRVFRQIEGKISASPPSEDPKGMGVAGVLTEIFGIPSTLDIATNEQLERRRHIESMIFNLEKSSIPLPENENLNLIKEELKVLNKELDNLGISRVTRDPMFQEFQAQFDKEMNYQKSLQRPLSLKEQEERDSLMEKIMKDIIAKQGI